MSDHEEEKSFSHVVADDPPPPPSTSVPTHHNVGSMSLTVDPQLQAALTELRQQQEQLRQEQDEHRAQHTSAMLTLSTLQEELERRLQAPNLRPVDPQPALYPAMGGMPFNSVAAGAGINPALLATPATVRVPVGQPGSVFSPAVPPRVPNPQVARGLFGIGADNPQPPPPPRPYNDEEKGWDKWVQDAKKTIKIDPFKGGTQDERKNIRTWVTSLSMQLNLIAAPRRANGSVDAERLQQEQARVASTYLQDGALDWALMYQYQCSANNQLVRWDSMSYTLMAKYEGQDHGLLRRQELQTLTYKRGRCTDLPKYEGEFDRLALLVHGSNMQIPAVDDLLGQLFAAGIQRGDDRLYESMLPVGSTMPQSLQEWKARAESAMVRSQALKLGSQNRTTTAQATVHNTEATDTTATESSLQSTASSASPSSITAELVKILAAMQKQSKNDKKKPQGAGSKKYQLTADERTKLFAARRCFCCYKVGHPARDCSQKATLPTRAPTADELKV